MDHTTLAIVGMLAIAAALIGAAAVSVTSAHAAAAAPMTKDPNYNRGDVKKKNSIDIENSETDFSFKQKLKNNCSGFADCTNQALETLGGR
jgi:serine protease inhibitor ecotin